MTASIAAETDSALDDSLNNKGVSRLDSQINEKRPNEKQAEEKPISPALRWKRAIDRDNGKVLWRLLDDIDVHNANDKGKTALMAAAKIGDHKLLEELVRRGLSIEEKSLTGGTALMYSVLGNKKEMIAYLLPRTSHIDAQSTNGWTAAMIAAAKGFDSALAQLVDAGAIATLADVYQWTPLMRAIDNKHRPVINYLLSQPEPAIDPVNENGSTALHVAAQYGDIDTVRRLLELGASASVRDKNGSTASEVAESNGHLKIAELIKVRPVRER